MAEKKLVEYQGKSWTMSEIATSVLNPNSIYSEKVVPKNEDPVCVDVKGEEGSKKEKSF